MQGCGKRLGAEIGCIVEKKDRARCPVALLSALKSESKGIFFTLCCFSAGMAADYATPLGISTGVLYVPFVLCALLFRKPYVSFWFAGVASLLIGHAYFYKDQILVAWWVVVVNRGLSLFVVWVIAVGVFYQKKAARIRQRNESNLQAILDSAIDGIVTIDDRGIIKKFNPACIRLFGYQPEEVIGRNVKMLMPEPYHSAHDGYLQHYLATGEKKVIGIGREVAAMRKDGSVFPMELGVNEMLVDGAHMFVGTIRDVTDRKRSEAMIHDYMKQLERSNKELDDFTYIASHDLKEPLRGLANNANFIREDHGDKLDEDGLRRLNRIGYLCQRMERLVDDLLYFSRLGRQELAVQKTDLNDMVRDIALMMEDTLKEKNVRIEIPAPLPTITCDLPRVTELFRNLITNAVKYNKSPEKRVEIGVIEKAPPGDGSVRQRAFYVKDNGIGIDEKFYGDVFRIFKRLNEEDDGVKGTGVGLTFVKKIVERHNGVIWIDSEIGEGTTFYFTLNLEKGE